MHDIRLIRDDPAAFDAALARRGAAAASPAFERIDAALRSAIAAAQSVQASRNSASKAIGAAKGRGDEAEAERLLSEVADHKQKLAALEEQERALTQERDALLAALPNLPAADVPDGRDEDGNVEQARWGSPREVGFTPRDHADLGPPLGLDFDTAVAMSGARFALLRGPAARLNRALGAFMLDAQTAAGYTECAPPLLVRDEALFGTGQLPKFADDLFRTADGRWLIPTAEVSLTNIVRDRILDAGELPLRFTALTPCFRSEAGAAGKDTRGLIRQHQFDKVELVSITTPDQSATEHERMTEAAEAILRALNLPYRRMLLCAGDMGFSARKTYDLEVWLPGQQAYREISSCSNCGDFQARRMNARFRNADGRPEPVHTLNGSGLAVGRTLVALLENHQNADGSIAIPEPLRPYLGGIDTLRPG